MSKATTPKKYISGNAVARRVVARPLSAEKVKEIKVKKVVVDDSKKKPVRRNQHNSKKLSDADKKYVQSVGERVEQAIANAPQVIDKDEGRPLFDGKSVDVVLAKLEAAFGVGATDKEACIQADISESSLYRYEEKHPEFRERKHLLKTKIDLSARATVAAVITERDEKNVPSNRALETSKWHLERKVSNEYANKQVNANFNMNANPLTSE